MANVCPPLQQHIPFPTQPVGHSPSPFSFGFGLNSIPHPHASPATLGVPAAVSNSIPTSQRPSGAPARQGTKRRLEQEPGDEDGGHGSDATMSTRSPSPTDRTKRLLVKRLRVSPNEDTNEKNSKDAQATTDNNENIDVGVLLASLPPQSLLPILSSLLAQQPSLKPLLMSLIPRPTLETALQALSTSVQKLREAQPYSQPATPSLTFGFGSISTPSSTSQGSTMREAYVQSRLRPSVAEFASTALSYLSYFSSIPPSIPSNSSAPLPKPHPAESFTYLHAISSNIHRSSPVVRGLLANESPQLGIRLSAEWNAWIDRVDEHVNRNGGMFSSEVVKGWERYLDEMVGWDENRSHGANVAMKLIRDKWNARVGWLAGRNYGGGLLGRNHSIMDED